MAVRQGNNWINLQVWITGRTLHRYFLDIFFNDSGKKNCKDTIQVVQRFCSWSRLWKLTDFDLLAPKVCSSLVLPNTQQRAATLQPNTWHSSWQGKLKDLQMCSRNLHLRYSKEFLFWLPIRDQFDKKGWILNSWASRDSGLSLFHRKWTLSSVPRFKLYLYRYDKN